VKPYKGMILLIGLLACESRVNAEDWPQWRGPNRDGVWTEQGVVKQFSSKQLPAVWRKPVGSGYCGPTVARGRVYVMDRQTDPAQQERVLCFEAATGRSLWTHTYPCKYVKVGYPAGPRASVSVDENRAYSLGSMGHLFCLTGDSGTVLWEKDLNAEYQIRLPIWGIAASPLIEGDLVIVHIGGKDNASMVAFDKRSGKERWRALDDKASYSAPIVIQQAGKRVLVCWTGERVVGINPLNGRLYWEYPFAPFRMVINIASPVLSGNYLFMSGFYDGSLLLKLNPDELTAEKVWRRRGKSEKENETDALHCCISTPLIEGEYIYGVDSYGQLRCLDLHTGDRIWESLEAVPVDRWSNIHMVKHEQEVWMFTERGDLVISRLSPQAYTEISRTHLIEPTEKQLGRRGGVCWSHPAYADRHIFVRNDKELLCVNLAAE
jgi:outer membrane protein assembly factor BamB